MAKRKKRKIEKEPMSYQVELGGIILILIAIIGIGRFGPVGRLIGSFGVFLFGNWWIVLYLTLMVSGIYMIIKRESPNFFTSKLVGLYIIFIGLLALSHLKYISANMESLEVLKATLDNFMSSINLEQVTDQNGGGVIGLEEAVCYVGIYGNS